MSRHDRRGQMSKAELSVRIATETSQSRAGVDDAVSAVFPTLDCALASGQTDRIAGFRTFSMRSLAARHSRHPLARAGALPSTPRRRLPSRPATPSARSSASGFGEREYSCRTVPMRRSMHSTGKGSAPVSAPSTDTRIHAHALKSYRDRSACDVLFTSPDRYVAGHPKIPIQRPVGSPRNHDKRPRAL